MGMKLDDDLVVDLILMSLHEDYNQFVMLYHMHVMTKSLAELHGILKSAEQDIVVLKTVLAVGKTLARSGGEEPEVYLEWERQMEPNFECYSLTNRRKIQYAAAHLAEDAIMWWEREERNRRRAHYDPVSTWKEMKIFMRKRYVPRRCLRDMQYRFDNIMQGDITVEEYYGEFEQLIAYLRIDDDEELMMHFLGGLQKRIARKVKQQVYRDLGHLVHAAIQIERQMNKKPSKNGCQRMPTPTPIRENFSNTGDPIKAQNLDARKDETISYKREVHIRGNKTSSSCTYFTSEVPCSECRNQSHLPSGSSIRQEVSIKDNGAYNSIAMAVERHLEEDFEAPSDKENKSVTEKKETVENPGFVRETKPKSLANVNEERQNAKDECIRAQTPTRNNLVKIKDQGKATDLDAREEETIVILKGVTSLGNETFSSCTNQTREGMYHMCRNQCHVACHCPNQRKNLIKDGGTYKADVRNLEDESDVTSKAVTEHVTKEKETIKDSDLVLNEVLKSVINVDEELHGIRIDALEVVTRNEDLKILINSSTKINDTSNNRTWIISQELGAKTDFVHGRREESDESHMCASTVHQCSRSQMRLPLHHERLKA
ncbi:PREDICTED: uncharacterized protein LOC104807100 [Tarenaya hassleriana]|uniref:uncharacterized protein LOC104807100 n=1 Tax=Tarenaya hassleriana TaxID=28532 RepID=UPI0008FCEE0D|nr:PREDICTED: uncharacterized protein LOC104807100 [Tarenaya hassleriana]